MKQHDAYWDNAKALLITLVVAGHFCECFYNDSKLLLVIWEAIFVFHMPAFILVSGIFLRKTVNTVPFRVERVFAYMFFYLFIMVTYNIMCGAWFGWDIHYDLFIAVGPQWYMLAIAAYISFTHLIKDIRPEIVLIGSVVLALLAGYDDSIGDYFAVSRVIVAYPFFYAGYNFGADRIKAAVLYLKSKKIFRIGAISFFCMLIAGIACFMPYYLKISALCTMRNSYHVMTSIPLPLGGVVRLCFYCLTCMGITAFLVLVPLGRTFFTDTGSRTMQIYILHGYITRFMIYICFNEILSQITGQMWPVVLLALSLVCTEVLSFKKLEKPFRYVMDIKLHKIYKNKDR